MSVHTIKPSKENIQSRFRAAAKAGEFLITAEVAPPKGGNPDRLVQMALALKDRVHAINVTDGSRAVLRMSPLAASAILLQHGIEPICQMACRDRNRIALQADLMGANALGIRNILALTGDLVKVGDFPKARGVFDLESVRLLQTIERLNRGLDGNDRLLSDGATELFAGAAVDPQLSSWSGLQRRFERKVAAGAEFFQSQAVFDFDRLDKFMNQVAAPLGKPILAGIFLLKSAKNAQFLNRCVPGVKIPEATIARLEQASEPLLEGMLMAAEQVQIARQLCQGVHLMAVKREELIPQILDLAGVPTLSKSVPEPQSTLAQF